MPPRCPTVMKLKQNQLTIEDVGTSLKRPWPFLTTSLLPHRPGSTQGVIKTFSIFLLIAHHPLWRWNTVFLFRPALSYHVQLYQYLEEIWEQKVYAFEACDLNKGKIYLKGDNVFRKRTCKVWTTFSRRTAWENPQCVRLGDGAGGGNTQHIKGTVDMHTFKWHHLHMQRHMISEGKEMKCDQTHKNYSPRPVTLL